MKDKFISDLKETGKKGIEDLLAYLEEVDFYEKPASIRHHLNRTGGLLEHTENVKREYLKLNEETNAGIPRENIIIQASVHDLEKCFSYTSKMQHTITQGQNNFLRSLVRDNMELYNNFGLDKFVEDKEFIISKEISCFSFQHIQNQIRSLPSIMLIQTKNSSKNKLKQRNRK